jgi:predicted permease
VALLRATLPHGFGRESLLGDLAEEYRKRHAMSVSGARLWYWRMALQVSVAFLWDQVRTAPAGLGRDLRFAVRSFRRSPRFTIFTTLTLAVGVGATTSMFSVADALLLRPLPFRAPDELVRVYATEPASDEWTNVVAGATYLDWQRDARSFQAMAAFRSLNFSLPGDNYPERVRGASVTSNFFEVMGVTASLGRLPRAEDGPTAERTVVLSYALWRSRYGSDPGLLGTTIALNGQAHRVVAILPPDFRFPDHVSLYVPSPFRVPEVPGDSEDYSENRGAQYLSVIGRLKPGVGVDPARSEVAALAAGMAEAYPDTKAGEGANVVGLAEDMVGDTRATLFVLLGGVAFVMLIACANVANLLTVRASERSRELAVRMAVGAGVGRVRRQLLTEGTLLALLGGIVGFALAGWGTRVLLAIAPDDVPRLAEVSVNLHVFVFSLVLALATGLLFGLAPSVGLSERSAGLADRLHGDRAGDGRRGRLRDAVVVMEVALSMLLLIGAGLMVRTLRSLEATDPGFDPHNTLVAHVSLPTEAYPDTETLMPFYREALRRIQDLPGVESAGTMLTLPVDWAIRGTLGFSIEGRSVDPDDVPLAGYQIVSPDLFSTLRIPIRRGRGILDTDDSDSETVAVVNEALAERYWPGQDPLGRRLTFWGDPDDPETEWATIVGVVANTVKDGLDSPPEPEVFFSQAQIVMNFTTFVLRTRSDPYALVPALRAAIAEVDPSLPLYGVSSLEDVLSGSLARRRFRMFLLSVFAGAALLMAAVGLYAVLSFAVARRSREIGIRRALGARSEGVVVQVLGDGFRRVVPGLVLGVAASYALARLIQSQVYGVSTTDTLTYAASAALLAFVSVVACLLPATRAARVDPMQAIRGE